MIVSYAETCQHLTFKEPMTLFERELLLCFILHVCVRTLNSILLEKKGLKAQGAKLQT